MIKNLLIPLLVMALVSCKSMPETPYFQAATSTNYKLDSGTLYLNLNNPLKSPMRYYITSSDSVFNQKLKPYHSVILPPLTDSIVTIAADSILLKSLNIGTSLGDPHRVPERNKLSLPFPKGRSYRIIQAYEGSYSHNEPYSKYAVDFSLKVGDTICAADDGVVVGVIQDYRYGGANKKWKSFANFITLYHPHSGLYTQYVHLKHKGSFVITGDEVKRGQPIALSGKTGWTDVAHLHFNAVVAVPGGLVSVPVTFYGGIEGAALKRDEIVTNNSKF